MSEKDQYVVQVKRGKLWILTIWTGYISLGGGRYKGKPVSLRSAEKALIRAEKQFPDSEFRVHLHEEKKAA